MLKSNTIRFITDTFGDALNFVDDQTPEPEEQTFSKQALLVSKTPLDCTEKTAVSNFLIEGEAPTGTKRRLVFKIDDALYKFDNNGQLIAYTGAGEFADVIQNGNQAGWLNSLSNITAFAGKKIYPVIALQAPYNAEEFPTIKVSLVTSTGTSSLTNTQTSPVYELADEAQTISEIADSTTITGQATCEISVRLRNNSTNTDEETDNWSAYMTLAQAAGKQADAVQFKVKSVCTTTDGTDSVEVKSIAVSHSAGEAIVSGSSARLFSTVQNYELDLQTCYVVVRHAPLVDAVIEAYVNFMELPKHRELITIGTATGSRQELTLGLDGNADKNIVATSIRLYVDEVPLYNFDFSTEISTVILSANKGAVITASYDYDYGTEEWVEMNARVPQPYNDEGGTYASRFFLNLSHANTVGKKISNVMIRLRRLSGSATENLGVATGKKQLFTLKHKAKPSTITFANTVDFSYDEESGILALVAARGTALKVSYNWQGENITVRSFAAGWVPTAGYDYQEGDYEYSIAGGGSSDYVLPTMAPNVKGGAKVGANLYMTGDTLNAGSGFFRFFNFDIRDTEIESLDLFSVEESYFNSFVGNTNRFDKVLKNHGWEPQYGDIVSVYNGRDYPAVLYRNNLKHWKVLGSKRAGSGDWNATPPFLSVFDHCFLDYIRTVLITDVTVVDSWYNPPNWSPYTFMDNHWNFILTKADRKLLDYLHEQFDSQIPT